MKICFFLPTLSVGGAERHTLNLYRHFRQKGFHCSVLIFVDKVDAHLLNEIEPADRCLIRARGMSSISSWIKVYKAMRAFQPDIVFTINVSPNIIATIMRIFTAPYHIINVFHSTILDKRNKKSFNLYRFSLFFTEAIVFVSANQRNYWTQKWLTAKRIATITNGVESRNYGKDEALRLSTRESLGITQEDIVLTVLASFRPEKNHIQIVRVFANLRHTMGNIKLLLVGGGATLEATKELGLQLGVSENLIFVGNQSNVRPYLLASDVGILCSNAIETFSLASLELLACGCPMVMSDIGGASEIVIDGLNGYLFEVDNDLDLLSKLKLATAAENLPRLKLAARESISRHSEERMLDSYELLVDEISR